MSTYCCYYSCGGRLGLQATLHRAPTWTSSSSSSSSSPLPFVLSLLRHGRRLCPGTEAALSHAPSPKAIALPRSSIHAAVFSTSSRTNPLRPNTPGVVLCSTLPRDAETRAETKTDESGMADNGWKIKMLYDGECPLCMREVNMLRERNKSYGDPIKFVDICADDYAAEKNSNIDFETAMGRIHAIRQNGEVLTNIAAFRALYEEIGLGWVYVITYHQPWASILNTVYDFWAKYRLPMTGRPPLVKLLEKRRRGKVEGGKSNGERCRLE